MLLLGSEWRSPKLLASQLSIWPPEAPEAQRWLQQFYENEQQTAAHGRLSQSEAGQAAGPAAADCGPAATGGHSNLVVAAVGEGWEPR